jgi:transposase-like protein
MNTRKTRTYTQEFKQSAVQLALRSPSIKVAAKELGVPGPTLSTWVYQFRDGALTSAKDVVVPEGEHLDPATARQLKDNLAKLLEENKSLNKKISTLEEECLI